MKIMSANRIAPDGTPLFAASHLGLFCLPMSHKKLKDARFIWVIEQQANTKLQADMRICCSHYSILFLMIITSSMYISQLKTIFN